MSNSTAEEVPLIEKFSKQVWATKGARFNAHRRLQRQNELSLRAISYLSAYLIVLTVSIGIPAWNFPAEVQAKFNTLITAISLLLLVFSLLESARNYLVRADRLHRCAVEIGKILHDIDLIQEFSESETDQSTQIRSTMEKYDRVLQDCPENHDEIDYDMFRASHRKAFKLGWIHAQRIHLSVWIRLYLFYWAAIIAPPLVVIYILYGQRA